LAKAKNHSVANYNSLGVSKVFLSLHSSRVVQFEDHIASCLYEAMLNLLLMFVAVVVTDYRGEER